MALDHNILLESGTNEFEVVEFIISDGEIRYHFCINVAKVIEVINFPVVRHLPDLDEVIIGTANIRKKVVPIVDLSKWINAKSSAPNESKKVIVTYFNKLFNGFLVDEVVRIHRITWKDIKDYSSMADLKIVDSVLGVVNIDGKLIQLLDFERIIAEVSPTTMTSQIANIDLSLYDTRQDKVIYIAEDSAVIRKVLETNFKRAGYIVKVFENGGVLLNEFSKNIPDIVVTDLEMPGTSGDFVVRTIRKNKDFNYIPIIVFSSMASVENERKLISIGANLVLGKPELDQLIKKVDELTLNNE